jgi:Tfp pilus assembly protein PilO
MKQLNDLVARFSKLSPRQRVLVYVAAAIVGLAVLERVIYAPISNRLYELDQEIVAKESQLRRNVKNLAARAEVLEAYAPYTTHVSPAGSDEETTGRVLKEIEELARKSGLALINVRPKPATKVDVGKQYPVEVELDTQMGPLIKFIHGLHGSKYPLRVNQMRLDSKGGRSAQVRVYLLINKSAIQ